MSQSTSKSSYSWKSESSNIMIGKADWRKTTKTQMVWYGLVWFCMVWYGMVWFGLVWYGMVLCGMVLFGFVEPQNLV